ncbi:hypothetical protein BGZ80_003179, partial [Entomortierella chlamydospora]
PSMASTSTTLTIFCLISGERISRAFSVEVPSDWTIDKLKDSITSSLELWRVTLWADENTGDEGVITFDALHGKTKLNSPRTRDLNRLDLTRFGLSPYLIGSAGSMNSIQYLSGRTQRVGRQ